MEAVSWEQGADWAAVAPLIQARQQAMAARRDETAPQRLSALAERLKLERLSKEQQLNGLAPAKQAPVQSTDAPTSGDTAKRTTPRQDASGLSDAEQRQVQELKARDAEVRRHEQAHAAVGGQYAGAPTYSYQVGPDGRRYAIGGAVSIDVSPVAGDPEATVRKMEVVKAAALAPAEPSSADRQVASLADAQRMQALADLTALRAAERSGEVDRLA